MKRIILFLFLAAAACAQTIVGTGTLVFSGTVTGGSGGGTPGGLDTQLQRNNNGSFGGISGATSNGTFVVLTSPTITTGITPTTNDGAALGSTTLQFSDLFLAEGGVINWDNGDATLTQSGNVVTLAGAVLAADIGTSTATTASAGDNSTKVSTTAYADNAGLSTVLGTFASPNTAAGSVTWNTASIMITTSAAAATRTYTLPAAASYTGKRFMLTVGAGTNHVNLQPQSGAALVLSGVLLTADHYVQAATSAAGNAVIGVSDGTNWQIFVASGTWADASSP